MLASNHEMMDLFEHLGPIRIVERAGGTVEIEVAIPPDAAAPRTALDVPQDDPYRSSWRSVSASEHRPRAADELDRVRDHAPGASIGGVELD
jgi:hypothetical protein